MGKNPETGSGDLVIENLVSVFWVKNTYFFDADSGSGILSTLDLGSGMEKIGSGINIPDPCKNILFDIFSHEKKIIIFNMSSR